MTNLTGTCQYSTMCGWCTKWDKKCDNKIGNSQPSKEKYGKLTKPCFECDKEGWDMPECKECNTAMALNILKGRRQMMFEEIMIQLDKIYTELDARKVSNNCVYTELTQYSWDELCDMSIDLIKRLGGTK